MIYRITYKTGTLHSLIRKDYDHVEVYIYGERFIDGSRGTWRGTGPARRAIRDKLYWKLDNRFFKTPEDKEEEFKKIMKECVGKNPSYPIYLKVIETD